MTKVVQHYNLIEKIGEGSYGKVYKGENILTKEIIAIKKIYFQSLENQPKLQQLFYNEI